MKQMKTEDEKLTSQKIKFIALPMIWMLLSGCVGGELFRTVPKPTPEEMERYIDRTGKTKSELVAEFKRDYEGQMVESTKALGLSGCKIGEVTQDGFEYEFLWGSPGEERWISMSYKFNERPIFTSLVEYTIFQRGITEMGGIRVGGKGNAIKVYGLLESIYLASAPK